MCKQQKYYNMAKWQDKTSPKPKEKRKDKSSRRNRFYDYGIYDEDYLLTFPEETRNTIKAIQHEIVMEHMKTQNVLGNHITEETDRAIQEVNDNTDTRASEINANIDDTRTKVRQDIANVNTYIVHTLYPKTQEIDTEVEGVSGRVNTIDSKVDTLTTKVNSVSGKVDAVSGKVDTVIEKENDNHTLLVNIWNRVRDMI